MRMILSAILLESAMVLAGSLAPRPCLAAGDARETPPTAKLVQAVNEAREYWKHKTKNSVQFVAGNDLWQPGWRYKSGRDWLALVCDGKSCVLAPAVLEAKKKFWQGHYDEKPTAGQHLMFKLAVAAPGKPVAWFLTSDAPPWLKAGPVPSYYAGGKYSQLPGSRSTQEVLIEMPGGKKATLVPMLLRKQFLARVTNEDEDQISYGALVLQLRTPDKRQILPGMFGLCSGEVPADYLLWAGDLDGDGKPDFMISYIDADGPVDLFLSSAARHDQLVGLSSVFESPPFGGECDGGLPAYLE